MKPISLRAWLESRYGPERADQIFADMQTRADLRQLDLRTAEVVEDEDGNLHLVVDDLPIDHPSYRKSQAEWERLLRDESRVVLPADAKITDVHKLPFRPWLFMDLIVPAGFLTRELACHALWYYYLLARNTFEHHDTINNAEHVNVYEGEPDPQVNYTQLIDNIARIYGTLPEYMVKFWPAVDLQADALHLPRLPDSPRFRHNAVIELYS